MQEEHSDIDSDQEGVIKMKKGAQQPHAAKKSAPKKKLGGKRR